MVFSSAIFILGFFPIVFIGNYFIQPKYSNAFLLIASLAFYAWGEPTLVFLLIASILVNWLVGRIIAKFSNIKKVTLIIGILFNLCALGLYKYAGLLARSINLFLRRDAIAIPDIALPIGISFFTFQAISYIVDVYRGETKASSNVINVALYISFFPQLIAGPIVKYKDINQQIENRNITIPKVAIGFRRFIYGLSKKVLISNILGLCADTIYGFDVTNISGKMAWIASLTYTFQIYYDFSGYSDMAIGLSKMFGFEITENFKYPYMSSSIREFWQRWHISLGSWFKEYVYIPLGGSKKGVFRTYINLLIVFFLSGLWHGADFSFVIWGLYHGFFSIIERLFLQKLTNKYRFAGVIYCFLIVNLGWIFFRTESVVKSLFFINRMISPWKYVSYDIPIWNYADRETAFIAICSVLGAGLIQRIMPSKIADRWKGSMIESIYCIGLLIICIAYIASNTYNPFIYFQF